MIGKPLTMLAVGDIFLEVPQGEFYLSLVTPVLQSGDVVVGQGEVVFTSRGIDTFPSSSLLRVVPQAIWALWLLQASM